MTAVPPFLNIILILNLVVIESSCLLEKGVRRMEDAPLHLGMIWRSGIRRRRIDLMIVKAGLVVSAMYPKASEKRRFKRSSWRFPCHFQLQMNLGSTCYDRFWSM